MQIHWTYQERILKMFQATQNCLFFPPEVLVVGRPFGMAVDRSAFGCVSAVSQLQPNALTYF